MICEECGSDGEGGTVEDVSGRRWHFRKIVKDGKPHPVRCYGKFVEERKVEEYDAIAPPTKPTSIDPLMVSSTRSDWEYSSYDVACKVNELIGLLKDMGMIP